MSKACKNDIKSKKILVLGGNGFIGSHLVDKLFTNGYSVKIFDRPNSVFLGCTKLEDIEKSSGDITNDADLSEALQGCDICFHLISTVLPKSSNQDPIFDIQTNLIGSVKLLNHAVKANVKKIIFLSSAGTVYGLPKQLPINENHPTNPLCSYGIIKLAIEKYLHLFRQLYGLDSIVLRVSNPFGERQRTQSTQGAVAVFLGKILRNEPINIWGDGSVVRDYIYVSDVIEAMLKCIEYQGPEHIFNIGSGNGLNLNEVLDNIEFIIGTKLSRHYGCVRAFDIPSCVLNIELAIAELDWAPIVSFSEGLLHTYKALREQAKRSHEPII